MDASARAAWAASRPTSDHPVDTACVAPWVSIEFDPSGWVYNCCTSGMYPIGRIGEQRLADLWGGPRSQVLRESLQRWDLTVACGVCRWHLEHGRLDPVAAVYDRYPVENADPDAPYMMLFALSNRCNLGCIMCSPDLSTTLRVEAGLPPIESRYDDQFFADLEPFLPRLGLAKFLGGEPFLVPEHKRVWAMMDQLEHPPRMQVTTNGTVWTDYVEWLLDRFRLDISISVDAATAPTYEAIRRGGDFATLMRNVDRFAESCRRRGTEFHVSYCLLDQNAHELFAFLSWAEQFAIPASINLVTDLGLALHDLPLDELRSVRAAWAVEDRRADDELDKNRSVWDTQLAQLDAVVAEREAGIPPAPRQAQRAPHDLFHFEGAGDDSATDSTAVVAAHEQRLRRWSSGGDVAVVDIRDGRIERVAAGHGRLRIDGSLTGRPGADLLGVLEAAHGCPAWIVELGEVDGCTVRTVALAATHPERGTPGTLVRTIQVPTVDGWTLLLAEDRIYEPAVPVTLGPTRTGSH